MSTRVSAAAAPIALRPRRQHGIGLAIVALLPFLLFCLAVGAYPFAQVIQMSLSRVSLTSTGFQFEWNAVGNFRGVLSEPSTWQAMWNTALFVVTTLVLSIIAGLAAALLVNRAVAVLQVARNIMIWPAVIAPVVVSLIWLLILSPTAGGLNKVLETFGAPQQTWLNTGPGAMLSLIVVDIWHWTPVVFLFIYTALQSINTELFEAARMDGASERVILGSITLPLLLPAIAAVAVVRVIMGVKVFDEMYLLTAGGPNGATTLVSQQVQLLFFQNLNYGNASAFSLVVVAITTILVAVALLVRSRLANRV